MFNPSASLDAALRNPSGQERRVAVRHSCGPETYCQMIDPADAGVWPAWIRDLSATGIGLLIARRCEPGSVVAIELENSVQGVSPRLVARIIHALEYPNGHWLHGCAFTRPLTDEELQALV